MSRTVLVTLLAVTAIGWPSDIVSQEPDIVSQDADVVSQGPDATFRHARHRDFGCLDCHTMQSTHGQLLVRSTADCRSCHHTGERLERGCAACHAPSEMVDVVVPVHRPFILSVRDDILDREIRFDHGVHAERECAECHTEGPTLGKPNLDCQGCHTEHHAPTNSGCMSCHRPAPEGAHTLAVHTSCSGSGCHVNPPFAASPRTRTGCLWCHEDRVDHEVQGECVDCHFVSQALHSEPRIPS